MRTWEIREVALGEGRRLRVLVWPGEGRPLVLLHGLLDDCPANPRISAYADDVASGLSSLGTDECTLVGHSLGGA